MEHINSFPLKVSSNLSLATRRQLKATRKCTLLQQNCVGSGVKMLKSQVHYFAFLSLSFTHCKMGIITLLRCRAMMRTKGDNTCKLLTTLPGTHKALNKC